MRKNLAFFTKKAHNLTVSKNLTGNRKENNMDLSSLLGAFLGGQSTSGISQVTGTSTSDVSNILAAALPSLLGGASQQASQASTADSFTQALMQHAAANTSNVSSFFSNVDTTDGAKIVNHLFGSNSNATIKSIASSAGVTQNQASSVLSAAAPYLMSLIGQQTQAETKKSTQAASTSSLMSSLLGNVDLGSLAGSLLSSGTSTKKTTKSSGVNLSDGLDAGDVLGILGKLLK